MGRTAIYTLPITLVVSGSGPTEPAESGPKVSQDSNYVFTKSKKEQKRTIMKEEIQEILELEGNIQTDESAAFSAEPVYAPQYTCPDCGELSDGHECENCHYTENR